MDERKVFLGHRVRHLRRSRNETQAHMAGALGISPSYLNLIESNQRPLTVSVLIKLAQVYEVDLTTFADDDAQESETRFRDIFADRLFENVSLNRQDFRELARLSPDIQTAIIQLFDNYAAGRERLAAQSEGDAVEGSAAPVSQLDPMLEVQDFFHHNHNHFPELERAAEDLWQDATLKSARLFEGLCNHLESQHRVTVRVLPVDVLGNSLRRYDYHGRRILLNEVVTAASRAFHLAVQIAFISHQALLDRIVEGADLTSDAARDVARLGLANYFAGAVIMPYDRVLQAARDTRYDIPVLQARFDASFEQVAHRLTTLQRSGARGIPFFLVRIDRAGNVSKRLAAAGFAFSRTGGTCPRWNVHEAFSAPGRILTQIVEMPGGAKFFSVARRLIAPSFGFHEPPQQRAVALGCELDRASELVFADGLDLAGSKPRDIGINCRFCERVNCSDRAFAPVKHRVKIDVYNRGRTPYDFRAPSPTAGNRND